MYEIIWSPKITPKVMPKMVFGYHIKS